MPNASAEPVKKKRRRGFRYEHRKSMYGVGFITPWLLGTIVLFMYPVVQSFINIFYKIDLASNGAGFVYQYIKLDNIMFALTKDQNYLPELAEALQMTLLRAPLVMVFSLFIALILNQDFKGRTFVRAVFFLPVIISTGPVISIIRGDILNDGMGSADKFSSLFQIDIVNQFLSMLGLYSINPTVSQTIGSIASGMFDLLWNCGVQILVFLAALQTVPRNSREAASIEGATAWEFFWKITFPIVSPMILATLIYTVIDSFVDASNPVMAHVLDLTRHLDYGKASAMAWIYFAIAMTAVAIITGIFSRFVYYEN